jgi:hypothetical protein
MLKDPGGLVLPDDSHAVEMGERLARTLLIQRSNLRGRRCCIKVRDDRGKELALVAVDMS